VSSDAAGRRSLADYIRALVAAVDAHDPYAGARLRSAAAGRRARISLDDETVLVWFDGAALVVSPDDPAIAVDGEGRSDSWTVADLLDARVEATEALLNGRVQATGAPEAVAAMLHIIEILLDISLRDPGMQLLARGLVGSLGPRPTDHGAPTTAWYPRDVTEEELRVLHDLDLLADG
jgi:hypothetical protein